MIDRLLRSPWNWVCWLRLLMGVYLLAVGFVDTDYFPAGLGGVLIFMALTNTGCSGGSCALPERKS